jgi:hypothetical protein
MTELGKRYQPSPSPLFINSKFSLCIAAHLLQQTKASSALPGTADLPKFPANMGQSGRLSPLLDGSDLLCSVKPPNVI